MVQDEVHYNVYLVAVLHPMRQDVPCICMLTEPTIGSWWNQWHTWWRWQSHILWLTVTRSRLHSRVNLECSNMDTVTFLLMCLLSFAFTYRSQLVKKAGSPNWSIDHKLFFFHAHTVCVERSILDGVFGCGFRFCSCAGSMKWPLIALMHLWWLRCVCWSGSLGAWIQTFRSWTLLFLACSYTTLLAAFRAVFTADRDSWAFSIQFWHYYFCRAIWLSYALQWYSPISLYYHSFYSFEIEATVRDKAKTWCE